MLEILHHILEAITNYAIVAFEFVGVIVLILSGLKGIKDYVTHNPKIRLILAEGMALALEFKLGSEILRTVLVREINELWFIAGIIILRASLTFLIHWEIDYEERSEADKEREKLEIDLTREALKNPNSDLSEAILNIRFGNMEQARRSLAKKKHSGSKQESEK